MPIIDRRTRLKARRILRKQKRQVEAVTSQADENFDKHLMNRFGRLVAVKRFVLIWVVLVLLMGLGALWQVRAMDKFYLERRPVAGGTYREGIMGAFTNANPLFATTPVDASVSELVFSGLFKISPQGKIIGDLATSIDVSEEGKIYTVTLRENVLWHDGEMFNADDVIFTYESIQSAEVRSPLRPSWVGVEVEKIDDYTVSFEIPNALSSFSYSLINGIVPEHVLGNAPLADLRSSSFNTIDAIGTGQFKIKTIEVVGDDVETRQERIALSKNEDYYFAVEGPDSVVFRTYRVEDSLVKDFKDQVVQSMVGLTVLPNELLEDDNVRLVTSPLTSAVMTFFNNSSSGLDDPKVRAAMIHGIDVNEIIKSLEFSSVRVDSPFLKSHFAYDAEVVQREFDKAQALTLLDEAGWVLGENGTRTKDGKELKFRLVSQSLSEYATIAQKLQQYWGELGINVEAILQPEEDIQSGAIARHDYDILLYGIALGYDPDVFAYWHSTQADPNAVSRLNLSEFTNDIADEALEAGRTRIDEDLRKVKYKPFLEAWRDDSPAIGMYQPRFTMVVQGTFDGFESGQLSTATDRFYSIGNWKIRNDQVIKEDIKLDEQ